MQDTTRFTTPVWPEADQTKSLEEIAADLNKTIHELVKEES